MFEALETGFGLDVVLALQATRSGPLDALALILNSMGGPLFYLIVLLLVYWSLNRSMGVQLASALIVGGITNGLLKALFHRPRPGVVSSLVIPLVNEPGYGIPSGHVMISLVFWGYAAWLLRERWMPWALALYLIVMAWSRMYVGVHYPQDVIGGAVFGLITLALLIRLDAPVERYWNAVNPVLRAALVAGIGVLAAIAVPNDHASLAAAGMMIGFGPALELKFQSAQFSAQGTPRNRLLRYVLGAALTLAVFLGLRVLFAALAPEDTPAYALLLLTRYALTTLTAVWLWPWLALRFGLMTRDPARAGGDTGS